MNERWASLLRPLYRLVGRLPERVRVVLTGVRTPIYRLGSSCVIVDDEGRWLLVRHSYRPGWSLPGGGLSRGEDPAETARREMREELQIEVELGDPFPVVDGHYQRLTFLFPARITSGEPTVVTPELEEFGWYHPASLPEGDRWLRQVAESARRHLAGDHPGMVIPEH
ncbi:MAG: NUDIX domain-containing protein [Actinomycetota bacterium]